MTDPSLSASSDYPDSVLSEVRFGSFENQTDLRRFIREIVLEMVDELAPLILREMVLRERRIPGKVTS